MSSVIELYEHNQKAYDALLDMLGERDRACIIKPTGTGKFVIIAKMVQDNPDKRFLLLGTNDYMFNRIRVDGQGARVACRRARDACRAAMARTTARSRVDTCLGRVKRCFSHALIFAAQVCAIYVVILLSGLLVFWSAIFIDSKGRKFSRQEDSRILRKYHREIGKTMAINRVTIMGNLTRDAELRKKGKKVSVDGMHLRGDSVREIPFMLFLGLLFAVTVGWWVFLTLTVSVVFGNVAAAVFAVCSALSVTVGYGLVRASDSRE